MPVNSSTVPTATPEKKTLQKSNAPLPERAICFKMVVPCSFPPCAMDGNSSTAPCSASAVLGYWRCSH